MLARLLKQPEPLPAPLPPSLVSIVAPSQGPKRRSKRVRVCRLYPQPQPETLIHAKAILAFIQEHSPEVIDSYVPCEDLNKFYVEDLCRIKGWTPRHWTGIARRFGTITHKRTVRPNGRRLVGYRIPHALASES